MFPAPEGKWIVAQLTDRDRGDLILRLDQAADTPANVADFPLRLGIAVPLSSPAEFTMIDPLEHQIEDYIATRGDGILVAVISGTSLPFFREFISYVRPSLDLEDFRAVLGTRLPHLEIQSYAEPDPMWKAFRSLKLPDR